MEDIAFMAELIRLQMREELLGEGPFPAMPAPDDGERHPHRYPHVPHVTHTHPAPAPQPKTAR